MIATTSLGSFVVNLGRLAKIPRGEGRVFQIGGQSIAVFHTEDANVFATKSTCPQGDPLAEGFVAAEKVICRLHALVFDLRTGHPAGNECRTVRTYPSVVNEDGEILVGIEELLSARTKSGRVFDRSALSAAAKDPGAHDPNPQ